jgi:hypothetical protein
MSQAGEVHIKISMALAPLPADHDRREAVEAKIVAAAKSVMDGAPLMKGPLAVNLFVVYPPGAAQRKAHDWRITAPTSWDLARFIIPHLSDIVFTSAGQVAELNVRKVYGSRALTTITIARL